MVSVASATGYAFMQRLPLISALLETPSFAAGAEWFAANQPTDLPVDNFTKECVLAYTMRAAVREWRRGVRANAVSPGAVDTPILPAFEQTMDGLDAIKAMVGRHATPQDISPLVTFLASPASGWVNGQNLIADGGMFAMILGA